MNLDSNPLFSFLLLRFLQMVAVVIGVASVLFFVLRLSGDPVSVIVGPDAPPETRQEIRRTLGLDDPLWVQYGRFIRDVARLDFGMSMRSAEPALGVALRRLPATLELAVAALAIVTVVGITVGLYTAVYRKSILSNLTMTITLAAQAVPSFWLGLILILVFAVHLRLLPSFGRGTWEHLILPAITLSAFYTARMARLVRASVLEAMTKEHVRTARGKGLGSSSLLWRHVLRNAWIPIVTVLFLDAAQLIGGAVITEAVFAWPGIGRQLTSAVLARDYPVVQATVFVIAVLVVFLNFIADLLYRLLDPRIEL